MTVSALSGVRAGALPLETTGFVGRRREVVEVRRLLTGMRLVTLTGVGGCGKTRLATRVATEVRRGFPDGVWMVDLASVSDAALLVHEVAATLGLRDQTQRTPLEVVIDFLRERGLLLLLDNCEHLLDGCAEFALPVLRGAAGVRVLCTSRQPLGIVGEAVWTVPTLAFAEPDRPLPADAQGRYPALALFVQRAAAVSPGFQMNADTAPTVVEICHRLDGLPLAIELAASRLRMVSLDQLAALLRAGFPALAAPHASRAGHGTLEAAFDWSYRLCTPAERLAWARVSVFAGSFGLAAAERVCAGDGLPTGQVFDTLAGLVDKSVLIRLEHPEGIRYRLLTTVREYGLARLRAGADARVEAALRARHRDWYIDMTARFDAEWFGPDEVAWLQRIQLELPELRAALEFCLKSDGQTQPGLTLAANLSCFWYASGQFREAEFWYRRVLAADPRPTAARLRTLSRYCDALNILDSAAAIVRAQEGIELARQLGDTDAEARGNRDLASGLLMSGKPAEAQPLAEQATAYFVARRASDYDLVRANVILAGTLVAHGEPARAASLLADCRDICRRCGDQWGLGHVLHGLALVALTLGDMAHANGYLRESLPPCHALGDTVGVATSVERLAWIAAVNGDFQRAAHLLGAARQQWHLIGQTRYGAQHWLAERQKCEAGTRAALGDPAYEQAFRRGAAFTLDQAVSYALGETDPRTRTGGSRAGRTTAAPGPTPPTDPTALTPREWEVAQLVALGLSNNQIAARLLVSQRTAESHVENILRKLDVTNRAQIAVWATTHDLGSAQ